MTAVLLVMSDGRREYLEPCVASAVECLDLASVAHRVIHDDSGSVRFGAWLRERYPDWHVITTVRRSGFAGAIRSAWAAIESLDEAIEHVVHLEGDFTFNRPVPLGDMLDVLDAHPHLAQVALRRQPWNEAERQAGGIVELHPHEYADRVDGLDRHWLEHRLFFTTNPSVYRRSLLDAEWPDGERSEARFTEQLLMDGTPEVPGPEVRFAYWGRRTDGPWVTHIGEHRAGHTY